MGKKAEKEMTVEERLKALEVENADLKKSAKDTLEVEKGMSNEEILQKAAITTADIAAAGRLNDAQSNAFIDFVIDGKP